MGARQNYDLCAVCGKERATRKERGQGVVMKDHNRWNGTKMVWCKGSGKKPGKWEDVPKVIFRNA